MHLKPPSTTMPPWWTGTRGEWWVVGQGVLMAALVVVPAAWTWDGPWRPLWRGAGGVLILLGLGLAALAVRELGPNLSALPRPRGRAVLVQTGLYAHTRHPIYGGLILAAVGWALVKESGLHLLLAGGFAGYLYAKAVREEGFLQDRFPEYADYRARTRRLIPWVF
ncbi:MAG: isoprenylcysteine carboxylmethyltransferase family protein [Armatimonadota bacterium]|nr:isoprenylcysteine carboxylmethyltransferase family protein [Armatimonadota bacterium]